GNRTHSLRAIAGFDDASSQLFERGARLAAPFRDIAQPLWAANRPKPFKPSVQRQAVASNHDRQIARHAPLLHGKRKRSKICRTIHIALGLAELTADARAARYSVHEMIRK